MLFYSSRNYEYLWFEQSYCKQIIQHFSISLSLLVLFAWGMLHKKMKQRVEAKDRYQGIPNLDRV